MDNLIAEGKTKAIIIVMENGGNIGGGLGEAELRMPRTLRPLLLARRTMLQRAALAGAPSISAHSSGPSLMASFPSLMTTSA